MDSKTIEKSVEKLEGRKIKEIYKEAEVIARLHQTLTSPRGNYFRLQMLQSLRREVDHNDLKHLRESEGLGELDRHLNKLKRFNLVEELNAPSEEKEWRRTPSGEKALNAVRALETSLGEEEAKKLFQALLGINSIRFFLHVYSVEKEIDPSKRDICFTSQEIGKFSLFLPRSMEGYAAIDKLSDANILTYEEEDGLIHFSPVKARAYYEYLKKLRDIVLSGAEETHTEGARLKVVG